MFPCQLNFRFSYNI